MTTLDTALQLNSLGMVPVIIPPNQKGPKGQAWQNRRYTDEELHTQFCKNENVGVLLGPPSGVVALDCDNPQAQEDLLELFDGHIPLTPHWISKHGGQHLFQHDDRLESIGKAVTHWKKVEVRLGANGKAAQSLLPPSTTDGFKREWIIPLSTDSLPAKLPESVIQKLIEKPTNPPSSLPKPKHLIVDPAYLCMPGTDAANLFIQGSLLRHVSDICQRHGVGLILAHHTRKRGKMKNIANYEPPELDDMAWAGFAEFARQWLLIGRREEFTPGSGEHKLWLSIGGSAGHSALWAVDIEEGVSGRPRHWKVLLSSPDEARAEKKTVSIRQRLLDAAREFPAGETKTAILETAKLKSDRTTRTVFDALVADNSLVPCKVKKNVATYDGFRLSPETPKGCYLRSIANEDHPVDQVCA